MEAVKMNRTRWIYFLGLVIISLASITQASAQKNHVDYQAWLGGSAKLDFKKGWAVTLQYRGRKVDDMSRYYGTYWFVTTDYKINKNFGAFVNYRYASVVDVGTFHRYAIGAEARTKWNHFIFSFRPMLQRQNQFFLGDDEQNKAASLYLRPRVQIKYRINKRLNFYVYGEPFLNLANTSRIDWWQNSAGIKYDYRKGQRINFFYIWQPDYEKKNLHTYHIFAIDMDFTIKIGKKKGKKIKEEPTDDIDTN
jgi:hypothetical protein